MNSLFQLLVSAFQRLTLAVVNPFRVLIRRVQQLFNINLITAKLIVPLNQKIRSLMSLRPQSRKDYVTVGGLWVYKKLILLIVLVLCAGVFMYFMLYAPKIEAKITQVTPQKAFVTYDYDDKALAAFSGKANIRAAGGAVVYTGDIAQGICTGVGTLYDTDGALVFEGNFVDNKYSGAGVAYYPGGGVQYEGEFADNRYNGKGELYTEAGQLVYDGEFKDGLYDGKGQAYAEDGTLLYDGGFLAGAYHGEGISYTAGGQEYYAGEFFQGKPQGTGTLFNAFGKAVYTGPMFDGAINYQSLLGLTLADIAVMFPETPKIYYTDDDSSFVYEDAGIILSADCRVRVDEWTQPGSGETDADLAVGTVDVSSDLMAPQAVTWYDNNSSDASDSSSSGADSSDASSGSGSSGDTSSDTSDGASSEPATYPDFVEKNRTLYFEVDANVWQTEQDLDKTKVLVKRVTVFGAPDKSATADAMELVDDSPASLEDCVAINTIRVTSPTAFGEVQFEIDSENKLFARIWNINYAGRVMRKAYGARGIMYKACYPSADAQEPSY